MPLVPLHLDDFPPPFLALFLRLFFEPPVLPLPPLSFPLP